MSSSHPDGRSRGTAHRIYVVDDHAVTRSGYAFLFGEEDHLVVCGESDSALDALNHIPDAAPDLVIADISMEGMNGIEFVKQLKSQSPEFLILVISMHDEALYAERALRAGAQGYLMKTEASRTVIRAARHVLSGRLYLSEVMSDKMLQEHVGQFPSSGATSPLKHLSDRELEVLEYLGQGLRTGKIADAMHISRHTVESYRARLKKKLGLADGSELLRFALRHTEGRGLI